VVRRVPDDRKDAEEWLTRSRIRRAPAGLKQNQTTVSERLIHTNQDRTVTAVTQLSHITRELARDVCAGMFKLRELIQSNLKGHPQASVAQYDPPSTLADFHDPGLFRETPKDPDLV